MKIVFFVYKFPVASETFVLNQIAFFIKNNIDVEIVSVFPGDMNIEHKIVSQYNLMNKVRFLLDKEPNTKIQKIIFRLSDAIPMVLNKLSRKSLNFKEFGYYSKTLIIPKILTNNKLSITGDVIVSHFATTAALLNQLKRLGFVKGKTAAVLHGNDVSQKRILTLFNEDYKHLFNDVDYIFPVSQLWAKKVATSKSIENKINVVRMGVDIGKFIYKKPNTYSESFNLLTIARLTEKKGIEFAIKACSKLKEQGLKFHYNIIGDGPLRDSLCSLAREYNVSDVISFLGMQSQESVSEYLANSDLFVLPSVTASDGDMEGIPVALMEAMAVGLPVVSTYHSGIPELIENGVSGYLVPERDIDELARTIMRVSKIDIEEIKSITLKARETIETTFNRDLSFSKMLNILS